MSFLYFDYITALDILHLIKQNNQITFVKADNYVNIYHVFIISLWFWTFNSFFSHHSTVKICKYAL